MREKLEKEQWREEILEVKIYGPKSIYKYILDSTRKTGSLDLQKMQTEQRKRLMFHSSLASQPSL